MQENGSPTPSVPTVFSADGTPAQCYLGPGTEYQPSFTFKTAQIVGKDATNLWWYLELYDKLGKPFFCWVNAKKISTAGDLSNIAITESETASVTAVNISFDGGDTQTVICNPRADQPEFRFSGEIVTNGPVKNLRYQWETTSGEKSPPEQIQVLAWDDPARFKINLSVPAQEGSYSLTLRTIYPNEVVRVVQFVVKCQ